MTTAQTAFAVALAAITVLVLCFGLYVVSSTMWGDRWARRRKGPGEVGRRR